MLVTHLYIVNINSQIVGLTLVKTGKISYPILVALIIAAAIITPLLIIELATPEARSQITVPSPVSFTVNHVPVSDFFKGTQDIIKISSQEELRTVLASASAFGDYRKHVTEPWRNIDSTEERLMLWADDSARTMTEESLALQSGPSAQSKTQHSTTNVQVADVDEVDYLKNDAKYLYIVSGHTLSILDVYPADSAKILLKIALDISESESIRNIFLNGDRLMIFYNSQTASDVISPYGYAPEKSYRDATHALIIDVSDKQKPVILKDYSIEGYFKDARMIGNFVYLVTSKNVDYEYPQFPVILEGSTPILTSDVFYFDNPERFSHFNTLTAIDILGDGITSETFLMGNSGTFYVSKDNFYLTYQKNTVHDYSRERFFEAVIPLLPQDIQNKIVDIREPDSWIKISDLLQDSYNKMSQDDRDDLFDKIRDAMVQYDNKANKNAQHTVIHKVSIDQDDIEYIAKGSVPGRLLNQFSMDQNQDRLRVATTSEYQTRDRGFVRDNGVYVLDEKLDIVGQLGGIAPTENIFSARFIGDRLYLVTFRQIDPFFVIDISTDTPKVLGELKIPGFSNYLHPYDEDHIIGVGRDQGVKIALFGVKDVTNPVVIEDVIIGDRSTHSPVESNHKAFFFDKTLGIISIPISGPAKSLTGLSSSTQKTSDVYWDGFYLFDVDGSGFDLADTIQHNVGTKYDTSAARTFYINDVLYTVSGGYVKMNSLENFKEINSINLDTGRFIEYID